MNDFFDSKFMKDLQGGKLPPVEIVIEPKSLAVALVQVFVLAVLIFFVAYLFYLLKK